MPHRIFTSKEQVAEYLHLSVGDLDRLIQSQQIPFERRGDRLVFRKVEMDIWATRRILELEGRRLSEYHQKSTSQTREFLPTAALIPTLIRPDFIDPALPAKTKASVIREMAALAATTGLVYNEKALLESLQQREELCSTGVPGGLALLHPRNPDPYLVEGPFIVLGRTIQKIPFGAPDGRATDLFFMLVCPDERLHLHALARLCLMAQKTDLLELLRQSTQPDQMYQHLANSETAVLPTTLA